MTARKQSAAQPGTQGLAEVDRAVVDGYETESPSARAGIYGLLV